MSEPSPHPLEPLSAAEVAAAVQILRDTGHVTPTTRFVSVSLLEPAKQFIHAPADHPKPPREAFAVLFDNGQNACYEAVVSITDGRLTTWQHIPGVQPTMTIDEQIECEQAVLASPEFRAVLLRHCGTDDVNLVMVDIWSAGNYGAPKKEPCDSPALSVFCAATRPKTVTLVRSKVSDQSSI